MNLDNPGTETLIELGMAYILGVTIVGFGALYKLRGHPFINKVVHAMFNTSEEAVDFIINL